MFNKPAFYIWTLMAPVLTGMIITVELNIPALEGHLGIAILAAAAAGFTAAIPLAIQVGKSIQ